MDRKEMCARYDRARRDAANALESAVAGTRGYGEAIDACEMVTLWRLALAGVYPADLHGLACTAPAPWPTWELMVEATNP